MPIGAASYVEPHPGVSADWLILGPGWVLAPALVAAGSAAASRPLALTTRRRKAVPRRSSVAAVAAAAGLPVPVVVGARFALEPGRGRSAVPVRPALLGAIAGVLGVLAAFTFAAGVVRRRREPGAVRPDLAARRLPRLSRTATSGPPARYSVPLPPTPPSLGSTTRGSASAQAGQVSVESFTYDPVAGKPVPVVLTDGRMPVRAGRDRARPHHRQRAARGHRLDDPAHRRPRSRRGIR